MAKQNITVGDVNMTNSSMNISQNYSKGKDEANILSKEDYVKELEKIIAALATVKGKNTQLLDAISDLKDALNEIGTPQPQPSVIRRFLNNSAALLNDVKDFVAPAAATAMGLKNLIEILPQIFK